MNTSVLGIPAAAQLKSLNGSPENRERSKKWGFCPSRFGADPEKIGRLTWDVISDRYGIGVQGGTDARPASCFIRMLRIDQHKDLLSAVDVVKYLDRKLAEGWRRRWRSS